MITDNDVAKIKKSLLPEIDKKLSSQTKEIKKYIHEGVDATVEGIDNLLSEYQFDSRIKKLEDIHPRGHQSVND